MERIITKGLTNLEGPRLLFLLVFGLVSVPSPPPLMSSLCSDLFCALLFFLRHGGVLSGELKGDYYPLAGSRSYASKYGGMSKQQEEDMRENHFLFQVSQQSGWRRPGQTGLLETRRGK